MATATFKNGARFAPELTQDEADLLDSVRKHITNARTARATCDMIFRVVMKDGGIARRKVTVETDEK